LFLFIFISVSFGNVFWFGYNPLTLTLRFLHSVTRHNPLTRPHGALQRTCTEWAHQPNPSTTRAPPHSFYYSPRIHLPLSCLLDQRRAATELVLALVLCHICGDHHRSTPIGLNTNPLAVVGVSPSSPIFHNGKQSESRCGPSASGRQHCLGEHDRLRGAFGQCWHPDIARTTSVDYVEPSRHTLALARTLERRAEVSRGFTDASSSHSANPPRP
jgi:hypothetical protein